MWFKEAKKIYAENESITPVEAWKYFVFPDLTRKEVHRRYRNFLMKFNMHPDHNMQDPSRLLEAPSEFRKLEKAKSVLLRYIEEHRENATNDIMSEYVNQTQNEIEGNDNLDYNMVQYLWPNQERSGI